MNYCPSVVRECAEVLSNISVNSEYRHLTVACGTLAASAAPGQFFQLLCPATDGNAPFFRRPMSLYGADPATRRSHCSRCGARCEAERWNL